MSLDFAVFGNAWQHGLFYRTDDRFVTYTLPAGAILVGDILKQKGHSVSSGTVEEPVRTQQLSLSADKNGAFFPERSFGWTQGGRCLHGDNAEISVAWGGGEAGFTLPQTGAVLWSSDTCLPDEKLVEKAGKRMLLLLSAEVLRNAGALISRGISWERTATELIWQLRNNPKLRYLTGIPEILVVFDEDGAVHIRQNGGEWAAALTLTSGDPEGAARGASAGVMPDCWAVITAACAIQWRKRMKDTAGDLSALDVGAVLAPAAALAKSGYTAEVLEKGGFGSWLDVSAAGTQCFNIPITNSEWESDPGYWRIGASIPGSSLQTKAFNYVLNGPGELEGIPRFSCGALTTVDRREIEAFQNIRTLITNYAQSKTVRPLSIAVFGAPGSGKSFGVTQIAKFVLPGTVEKLEFNVSQMTSTADLAAAFHRVRDSILDGKLPLVFFDEFDSDRDGRALGWLKSFLMPMQDGKFRDEDGEHPVGKCIMVFAGGTASSFEGFCAPMNSENASELAAFKNVKGPDFVSRLRGTIDVLGPNQAEPGEQSFILRRAILLRSLLERKMKIKGCAPVSPDVLWAMLLVPKYKHGARSMESILDMSSLGGASWEPASLPFYTQLDLHVDADAFLRLVLKDTVLSAFSEQLAKAIHEDFLAEDIHNAYVEENEGKAPGNAENLVPWEELSEEIRDSNRGQARDIPNKLLTIQCSFDAGGTPYPSVEEFTDEEIQRLAQEEHIRWMEKKARAGWVYDSVRNDAEKKHNCMLDWDKLPENERVKDENAARNIIPLLKKAGLRVYRMV